MKKKLGFCWIKFFCISRVKVTDWYYFAAGEIHSVCRGIEWEQRVQWKWAEMYLLLKTCCKNCKESMRPTVFPTLTLCFVSMYCRSVSAIFLKIFKVSLYLDFKKFFYLFVIFFPSLCFWRQLHSGKTDLLLQRYIKNPIVFNKNHLDILSLKFSPQMRCCKMF